jgi:hypothetical protein
VPRTSRAGIQALRLADHGVRLKPQVEYQWSVALVKDPEQRSTDVVSSGTIRYVKPSAALEKTLEQTDASALAAALAGEGYWYDALKTLSESIDAQPGNPSLREQRASLLEQVALPEVAAYVRK